jgi:hypothetical protein
MLGEASPTLDISRLKVYLLSKWITFRINQTGFVSRLMNPPYKANSRLSGVVAIFPVIGHAGLAEDELKP